MKICCDYSNGSSKEFSSFEEIENYDKIIGLNCSNNNLTQLPNLPNKLIYLDCSNNNLKELPLLPNSLDMLYCKNNKLSMLPQLPKLFELDCSKNQLQEIPKLSNGLVYLNCSENKLTFLPELPKSLEKIHCWCNQLETLPLSLIHCVYIKTMFFSIDEIKKLSDEQIEFIQKIQNKRRQLIKQREEFINEIKKKD